MKVNSNNLLQFSIVMLAFVLSIHLLWSGQSASDLLYGRLKANGIITAFYDGSNSAPAIVFRANKIYTDYERIGFFRIGALPIVVIEDLTIELQCPEYITRITTNMHSWIGEQAANHLEVRKIKILVSNGTTNYLRSGRAKFLPDYSCEFLDGVVVCAGNIQMSAPAAKLQISNKNAGMIIFNTNPPITNNIFKMFDFLKNETKEKQI